MTIKKAMLAILGCALAVACNRADAGGQGGGDAHSLASLPRLTRGAIAYPYTRYQEATGQTASRGRAFFLYPIKQSPPTRRPFPRERCRALGHTDCQEAPRKTEGVFRSFSVRSNSPSAKSSKRLVELRGENRTSDLCSVMTAQATVFFLPAPTAAQPAAFSSERMRLRRESHPTREGLSSSHTARYLARYLLIFGGRKGGC